MTTVQSMLARMMVGTVAALGVAGGFSGCAFNQHELEAPVALESPYFPARQNVLLAVAPPLNESGVSAFDPLTVGDQLVAAVSEARGLSGVPMNRTLAAMTAKGMSRVATPADARRLAEALGADGVLVSSVTAYDPYDPPKFGLSVALFMMETRTNDGVDPRELTGAYTDQSNGGKTSFGERPAATVVEHLDASNHEVLADLKEFATGRHDKESALTWRRYTASMELYTQFAAYHTVRRVLEVERSRLGVGALAVEGGKEQK